MLINWRIRAGYSIDEAEEALKYQVGKVQDYEERGLSNIPLCEIGRIVKLYEVSGVELMEIILLETAKVRPEFFRL